jgi:hypothetical protein
MPGMTKALMLVAAVHLMVIATPAPAHAQSQDPSTTREVQPFTGNDNRSFLLVHVDAPQGVLVQQDVTNNNDWQTVCAAPCDQLLQKGFPYRVTGDGIRRSDAFMLQASPGASERLVVRGASKTGFVLGVVGLVVGGTVGGLAALYCLIGLTPGFPGYSGDGDAILLAATGIGALVFIGGALLYYGNKRTKVDQDLGAKAAAGVLLPGSWTTPVWSTAAAERKILPGAVGIPIFSGRF